ncbi:MAG: PIN domain-containing protein [Acidimicrobiales bacterium]|nr:PIN domain-containing protein [Acidimicrobiales bacterium]MYD34165.1 PIN domain-containing protein [Acidimicrobiales bacterium]MYI09189.1 PIN domain-containing protein [Acidimicrobiales bacterium]
MIYLDTSVALAHLLSEDRVPPASLWQQTLVSSRLIEYEVWTQLHGRGLGRSHGEAAQALIGRIGLAELAPPVLARALEAFPGRARVRTLDALHLATCTFLSDTGQTVQLASYDSGMNETAAAMGIALHADL